MGLIPEQVIGKELKEIIPEKAAKEITSYYELAWKGKENVIFERELNDIYYITSLRPICRGGQVTEVIGSSMNISERKKAEELGRQSLHLVNR